MDDYYVDLHVHIGRSSAGYEVKKATANNLTFENIAHESYHRKGIDIIGVVDCIHPYILEDIDRLMAAGDLEEMQEGGMLYKKVQTLLLGAEIETHEKKGCSAHCLCFFPTLEQIKNFSLDVRKHMRNILTNSLMSRLTGQELYRLVEDHGGIFIPAHAFTPHKSFYGNCSSSLHAIFDLPSLDKIPAVELGLSADAMMASQLSELDEKVFISNSDAHSLVKMGREYNIFTMEAPTYNEVLKALRSMENRRVKANYGLNPQLGKYHRTFCLSCETILQGDPPLLHCPVSEQHPVVIGVKDRLEIIKDRPRPELAGRAPYHYQIPLEFIPKVGPKTIDTLIRHFGNEMNILHKAPYDALVEVVKPEIAEAIVLAREGRLHIEAGGGGTYGRIGTES